MNDQNFVRDFSQFLEGTYQIVNQACAMRDEALRHCPTEELDNVSLIFHRFERWRCYIEPLALEWDVKARMKDEHLNTD